MVGLFSEIAFAVVVRGVFKWYITPSIYLRVSTEHRLVDVC